MIELDILIRRREIEIDGMKINPEVYSENIKNAEYELHLLNTVREKHEKITGVKERYVEFPL
jgi:hypothetical protein